MDCVGYAKAEFMLCGTFPIRHTQMQRSIEAAGGEKGLRKIGRAEICVSERARLTLGDMQVSPSAEGAAFSRALYQKIKKLEL